MKKKIIAILATALVVFVLGIVSLNTPNSNHTDNGNPMKQESMIKCTLEWGRLAAFPDSKTNFVIKTEGNALTRAFRSSFNLPEEDLKKWIKASQGLQDAEITSIGDKKKRYSIKPGANAGFAEATVDFNTNYVEIYVYWS